MSGPEESLLAGAQEAAVGTAGALFEAVKQAWSVMDAAAEKPTPKSYLTESGIQAIQGVSQVGGAAQRRGKV